MDGEPGDLDALRRAFADLRATMDAIDGYRDEAVTNMAATVSALEHQISRAPGTGGDGT